MLYQTWLFEFEYQNLYLSVVNHKGYFIVAKKGI